MSNRNSYRPADLGMGGGRTTGEDTSVGKDSIPMPGAAAAQLAGQANRLAQNAPVFWLIAILLVLGMLKVGLEWKGGIGAGIKVGT